MKDIQDLHVIQVRIFSRDTIPYEAFSVSERLKQFKEFFHFSNAQTPLPLLRPGPKVVLFESGEFNSEKRSIIINRLNFEDRRVVLEILGNSTEANLIFSKIASYVGELSGKNQLDEKNCIIKTEETNCLVSLDLDFWDIFSGEMKKFIKKELAQMMPIPLLSIAPKKLSFEAIFKTRESLQEEGITISPKEFTIEPRIVAPPRDRVFFTQSPFDSESHLKLIQTFETFFASKIRPGSGVKKRSPEN